jgi:hypothetical protein
MPSARRFPAPVREAMTASGAAATCIPVELDGGAPEAAFFIDLGGPESKADRRVVRKWRGPLSLGLDSDVIETGHGAVVVLRPEVHTGPFDPFVCEVLVTPGGGGTHFEALDLLSRQPRLTWFFGDRGFEIIRTQQHPLDDEQREGFATLLKDALRHDAMTRMTGRYDGQAALAEVASHYTLRTEARRVPPRTGKPVN